MATKEELIARLAECVLEMEDEEVGADIIAMSTLMTTTMPGMREVVGMLEERGIRGKYKVMVGGSPISQKFCDEIGADIYTANAVEAVKAAKAAVGME
ncbi:MAG: cobalamin-dependent protein [Eggerthellaceae bacterium]